jgi:hypothetical protein
MGANTTTKTRLTLDECVENAKRICGVDKNAAQIPAFAPRCPNPVTWSCRNDGGHTQSGHSTLQEWSLCDEHAELVTP